MRKKWTLETLFWFLIVLITLVFYFKASDMKTFWTDEIYSVHMIDGSYSEIYERTSHDAHPPLYYFLLKLWYQFFSVLGFEKTIFIGRLLSWAGMIFGLLLARCQLDYYVGYVKAILIVSGIMLLPVWHDCVDDIRNYTWVMSLVLNAGIAFIWILDQRNSELKDHRKLHKTLWVIFAALMTIAWWMHLLVGLVLLWFGLVWVYFVIKDWIVEKKFSFSSFFVCGLIANLFLILAYLPWILLVSRQLNYLDQVDLNWMTPPTIRNLFSAMFIPITLGRDNWFRIVDSNSITYTISLVSFSVLVFTITSSFIFRKKDRSSLQLFIGGVLIYAGFVLTLWYCTIFEIASIFHGPRYPMIAVPFFMFILLQSLLSVYSKWDSKENRIVNGILTFSLVQYIVVLVFAILLSMIPRYQYSIDEWYKTYREKFPSDGSPVYVGPPSVASYWKSYFSDLNIQPVTDFNPENFIEGDTFYFYYSIVPFDDDDFLMDAIYRNIGNSKENISIIPMLKYFHGIVTIENASLQDIEDIITAKLIDSEIKYPEIPETAIQAIDLAKLSYQDGWDQLEIDSNYNLYRWGNSSKMSLPVSQDLPVGNYTFRMIGYRLQYHSDNTKLKMTFGEKTEGFPVENGKIDISLSIDISKDRPIEEILLFHPTLIPSQVDQSSGDGRKLSILLNGAWFEPALVEMNEK